MIGNFQNTKLHGKGRIYYQDGKLRYQGAFKNGWLEGKGKLYNQENGSLLYEGSFLKNKFHGCGKLYFEDGDWFDGIFRDDLRVEGTYYSAEEDKKYLHEYDFEMYKALGCDF
jgi:hypothetical protein